MQDQSIRYVYMSGALTGLNQDDLRYTNELYDRVAAVCKSFNIECYLPGKSPTTPTKGIPHHKVWKIDYEKVIESSLVIAYVGLASTGVGCELEMARTGDVDVVLLCEEDRQDNVSRLVLGNPSVVDIVPFTTFDDMEPKLREALVQEISKINLEQAAMEENWPYSHVKDLRSEIIAARKRDQPISATEWKRMRQGKLI